jgi:hypothetical protein
MVDLDNGLRIVDKEEISSGVDIPSSLSHVTSNMAIVSILNSTEEALEIRDLKVAATMWIEQFSVHKVNSVFLIIRKVCYIARKGPRNTLGQTT